MIRQFIIREGRRYDEEAEDEEEAAIMIQARLRGRKSREVQAAHQKRIDAQRSGQALLEGAYERVDTVQLGWLLRPTAKSIEQRRQQISEWVKKTHGHHLRLQHAEAKLEHHVQQQQTHAEKLKQELLELCS